MKRCGKIFGVLSPILLSSPVVLGKTQVNVDMTEVNLGLDYQVVIAHMDHGDSETKVGDVDIEVSDSATVAPLYFYLTLNGKLNKDLHWDVIYNLAADEDALEKAMVYKNIGPAFVGAGINYVAQGGFDNMLIAHTPLDSLYTLNHLPLPGSQAVVEAGANVAGRITLQLTQDVEGGWGGMDENGNYVNKYYSNTAQQPAMFLQWEGKFGGVSPLVQIGTFDKGHSTHTAVGVKYEGMGATVIAEYITDTRTEEMYVPGQKAKALDHTYTSMGFQASYAVGPVTPFLEYAGFDYAQPEDKDLGLKDLDVNTGWFDDHGTDFALGATLNTFGSQFQPTLKLWTTSGEYYKGNDSTQSKETRTMTRMILAFSGSF